MAPNPKTTEFRANKARWNSEVKESFTTNECGTATKNNGKIKTIALELLPISTISLHSSVATQCHYRKAAKRSVGKRLKKFLLFVKFNAKKCATKKLK